MAVRTWTPEDIGYLEDSWGATSIPYIAKKLGRTIDSIKNKAFRLGLTRHIHSGEYITYNQLLVALGMGESYVRTKFENNGIPIKTKKSIKKAYKIIYLEDFWEWAEQHKQLLNFKSFEEGTLGVEPSWVGHKRLSDKTKAMQIKTSPWSDNDDRQLKWLLSQYKFGYTDIARMLNRSEGAIKRRMCDLNVKARPIKAENHRQWQPWEEKTLIDMYKKGYTYEDISIKLDNRSVCATRGKIERLQYAGVI